MDGWMDKLTCFVLWMDRFMAASKILGEETANASGGSAGGGGAGGGESTGQK